VFVGVSGEVVDDRRLTVKLLERTTFVGGAVTLPRRELPGACGQLSLRHEPGLSLVTIVDAPLCLIPLMRRSGAPTMTPRTGPARNGAPAARIARPQGTATFRRGHAPRGRGGLVAAASFVHGRRDGERYARARAAADAVIEDLSVWSRTASGR
jgi:hypothetical protein